MATQFSPKFVELLAKFFIVCAESLDHIPHRLEYRTIQSGLGVSGFVDEHRDHDGADGLVLGLADSAPDCLNDIHL